MVNLGVAIPEIAPQDGTLTTDPVTMGFPFSRSIPEAEIQRGGLVYIGMLAAERGRAPTR
jgi:hypothetical protein